MAAGKSSGPISPVKNESNRGPPWPNTSLRYCTRASNDLKQRTALVARRLAVGPVLDPPVERQQGRAVAPGFVELVPEMAQRVRRGVGSLAEVPRQLAEHPDPLAERRQGELGQQPIEGRRTRRALLDLVEVARDRRGTRRA